MPPRRHRRQEDPPCLYTSIRLTEHLGLEEIRPSMSPAMGMGPGVAGSVEGDRLQSRPRGLSSGGQDRCATIHKHKVSSAVH